MLYYRNEMFKLVIMRCVGLEGFFREKVLFSFEEYGWDALLNAGLISGAMV